MLFKVTRNDPASNPPYKLDRMTVTYFPAVTLFRQEIISKLDGESGKDESLVRVTYQAPNGGKQSQIEIPLRPDVQQFEPLDMELHQSPTKAYNMGARYNDWFSEQFGYETMLVYIGPHLRPILGNLAPAKQNTSSWFSSVASQLPWIGSAWAPAKEGLTFTDVAAYLVVTEESLADVSSRLSEGMEADMTKFRPNIVLSGAKTAFEEDFWAEIAIKAEKATEEKENDTAAVVLDLTQNCARCKSLNIDYSTGDFGKGEVGTVLKKMMKDRRVDQGNKYSPIFGRYGFLSSPAGQTISIGDEVEVSRRNDERTTFGEFEVSCRLGSADAQDSLAWYGKLRTGLGGPGGIHFSVDVCSEILLNVIIVMISDFDARLMNELCCRHPALSSLAISEAIDGDRKLHNVLRCLWCCVHILLSRKERLRSLVDLNRLMTWRTFWKACSLDVILGSAILIHRRIKEQRTFVTMSLSDTPRSKSSSCITYSRLYCSWQKGVLWLDCVWHRDSR